MNSDINLVAFGTFGNPNGFRQTFFFGNSDLFRSVKTFDLNTNAIKVFPQAIVYALRKELAAGYDIISYAAYSFAKEQNSERSGTFIGSSVLFTGNIAEENITVNLLNEFHHSLISKNVQNDVITVTHSEDLSVKKPSDLDKIEYQLKTIENVNFIHLSNKNLVVYCETNPSKLVSYFNRAIDLLNVYDSIYFTQSHEVAQFVGQKGIFKLIEANDFEQELESLQLERRKKMELMQSEFEKEVQRVQEDQQKTLNDFKLQIEQNDKLHRENEKKIRESRNDLESVKQIYNDFSFKINDLINQLKSGRKLEEVTQVYNENKRRFIDGICQIKKPILVNHIPKANAKSTLKAGNDSQNHGHRNIQNRKDLETQEPKIDLFKVASFCLLVLLIVTWVYFLVFANSEEFKAIEDHSLGITVQTEALPSGIKDTADLVLNPRPNSQLNQKDYQSIAKKLPYNTKVMDVVQLVFSKNPTDIKGFYSGQEEKYCKQIIELNKQCFEEKEGVFYFVKDTLRNIPAYKKPNK